jgi:hypothetical protein
MTSPWPGKPPRNPLTHPTTHKARHLDRRRRACRRSGETPVFCSDAPSLFETSSRPKAAHFAAAVERPPYFAPTPHPFSKRHLDRRRRACRRSGETPVFCSDAPSLFETSSRPKAAHLPPQWRDPRILLRRPIPFRNVISTEGGALRRRSGETPASCPTTLDVTSRPRLKPAATLV